MNATSSRPITTRSARIALILTVFFMLLPWGSGPALPAHADAPEERDHRGEGQPALPPGTSTGPRTVRDHRDTTDRDPTDTGDPDARVQLVIRKLFVHSAQDGDGGLGEINLRVKVRANDQRCPGFDTADACVRDLVVIDIPEFSASTGDVIGFDRLIPDTGDNMDPTVRPGLGIPLSESAWAGFSITGTESDLIRDDRMGTLDADFVAEGGTFRLGVFTERSVGYCVRSQANKFCDSQTPGAFSVEYEIRKVPLPDLRPTIRTVEVIGQQAYCGVVENVGERPAGQSQLTIRANETRLRTVTLPALAVNETAEHCILGSAIPAGQMISFSVDDDRAIAEMNEHNNLYQWRTMRQASVDGPQLSERPAATPTPMPVLHTPLPDLIVSAITVNGQTPDGKGDCKDGKNMVAVTIKNQGTRRSGDFVSRLVVDAAAGTALEQEIGYLEVGKETQVTFANVRLTKGQHTLTAIADAQSGISESDETNNTLKVTVRCRDDE